MKVVIEALQDSEYVTGTDRFTYNVLRELQQLDHDNQYTVICRRGFDYISTAVTAANFRVVRRRVLRGPARKLVAGPWSLISALYYKWMVRPDVYYSTVNLSSPRVKVGPMVGNALDLIPLIYTKQYHGTDADYQRYLAAAQKTARLTDHFIAISEHTKRDMEKYLKVNSQRVNVVYLAAEDKFQPVTDKAVLAQMRETYHLPERFVLSIGSNEPRKNVRTAMKAYQGLPANVRETVGFVILGGTWKGGAGEELGDMSNVHFTGFVDDDDLPALYSAAEAFVFLSTYEGFGLPPLEAMACGTPVVTSDATSLPEVVGEAALTVSADDAAGASAALERILTNPEAAARLRTAGLARAAEFSWRKTAEGVHRVLMEVARG